MKRKRRFILEGRVQGVGCRAQVWQLLQGIRGLSGHVRNLDDGNVEICVAGEEGDIDAMPDLLRVNLRSPVSLRRIREEAWEGEDDEEGFRIRRD